VLTIPISNIEFSVRSQKCLAALNIQTIGDLVPKTEKELLNCKNFGNTSLQEVKQKLAELGVSLREE
jgi:DNA-directed RNA polymerase subunit alpha